MRMDADQGLRLPLTVRTPRQACGVGGPYGLQTFGYGDCSWSVNQPKALNPAHARNKDG